MRQVGEMYDIHGSRLNYGDALPKQPNNLGYVKLTQPLIKYRPHICMGQVVSSIGDYVHINTNQLTELRNIDGI